MEKKKIRKILHKTILVCFTLIFVGLLVLQAVFQFFHIGIYLLSVTYWVFSLGYLYIVLVYHLQSKRSLVLALCIFTAAAVISVLGFRATGEYLMKFFLVLWIAGMIQAMIEYIKHDKE